MNAALTLDLKIRELLQTARDGNIHVPLGFPSFRAYLESRTGNV
jgi:hypothetical protein